MSLSAAVTRILTLSGFPSELKTRDIQAAFGEWENERGGFKIKWVDDTTLMLVFQDAVTGELTCRRPVQSRIFAFLLTQRSWRFVSSQTSLPLHTPSTTCSARQQALWKQ